MNELALFAGAGGGILAGELLGWRCICAVEFEPYCAAVLAQRQNDGVFPACPIWDDVRTFDGRPWRGRVDVVSGGFPCQDISAAGKGAGISGERSGLWAEFARIIGEVRPRFAFVENSPALTSRGLDRVLGDLAALGYDAEWGVLGAADVGAPHQRDRIWIVAWDTNRTHERAFGELDKPRIASSSIREAISDSVCKHVGTENNKRGKQKPNNRPEIWVKPLSVCEVVAYPNSAERGQVGKACDGLAVGPDGVPQREKGSGGPEGRSADVADANGNNAQGKQSGSADTKERQGPDQGPL